ncbi:phosphoribosylformylglycinamidine synthase subunit PurL [Candidatus Daviesbacteria bacterium]|nr:phosphoribosylformylglycinamidine synthase subunit PurL [Candidatus Daviesbacteria bacterium]
MTEKAELTQELARALASEHTSYASTKKYLAKLPTSGRYVIQGPGENAGVLDLGIGWALALRIESHNHPSFINPYEGAATGVGGILRDIFTMGARPVALLDILRFGTDKQSKKIMEGVVRGISDYGTTVGVPVIGGDVYFDKTYNNNCLVNVCAMGLVKKKNIVYGNALNGGQDLIYVGARTGRDGVGGAQMASENLQNLDKSKVQDSDPFLEKLLLEACCELAQTDWIEGMQDMGAAGLLCSTTEIILRGRNKTGRRLGARIYLNKIPTKADDLTPAEFLLSESQERMMVVGKRPYREKILNLFKAWDLEAVVCGEVTADGFYTVVLDTEKQQGKLIRMDFNEILPDIYKSWELKDWVFQKSEHIKVGKAITTDIWRQYDWMVGTRTLKGPDEPGKYAILDMPETYGQIAISWSSDEGLSNQNPTRGVEHAFDNCYRWMEKLKAEPLGLTNCLNFGHPKDSMGAFAKTIDGLGERCLKYKVPVVSGNVSLYNAYRTHSIKPTPVVVMVGKR